MSDYNLTYVIAYSFLLNIWHMFSEKAKISNRNQEE